MTGLVAAARQNSAYGYIGRYRIGQFAIAWPFARHRAAPPAGKHRKRHGFQRESRAQPAHILAPGGFTQAVTAITDTHAALAVAHADACAHFKAGHVLHALAERKVDIGAGEDGVGGAAVVARLDLAVGADDHVGEFQRSVDRKSVV